jgi:hypothetical protein
MGSKPKYTLEMSHNVTLLKGDEKMEKPPGGPKRATVSVEKRRELVNVFRVLGRTQKRIAELLGVSLKIIECDCSWINAQPVTRGYVKKTERTIKRQLGRFKDAEILEIYSLF